MNNKIFFRVMAIILAALTALGTIAFAVASIWSVGAVEMDDYIEIADTLETDQAEDDASSALSLSDKMIRVGLFFRNSSYDLLRMNHSISSQTGFRFFVTDANGKEKSSFSSPVKSISVVREANLSKNKNGVYESVSVGNADIFRYALVTKEAYPNEYYLKKEIVYNADINGYDSVYPIFANGNMYLGIGNYQNADSAQQRMSELSGILTREMAVKSESDTYITIIDNESGEILLRADTAQYALKIEPNYMEDSSDSGGDIATLHDTTFVPIFEVASITIEEMHIEYDTLPYIVTAVGNIYAGTFEYKATSDGLTLINILTLDDYVKSVVPYEIYNNWPKEAIKAFSIASRTYALTSFHSGAEFDMCSETHCQAYLGRGRSTEYSDACVDEASGLIITYNGKPADTFYHASSGGSTESAANVWGGSAEKYPYLTSVHTPHEKYGSYTNGFWSTEVTMSQISEYVRSKASYSDKFSSQITNISVLETTPAGYVYKVQLTDSSGNAVTVSTADKIRILFSKFVKSANFILTRGIPVIKSTSVLDSIEPGTSYSVISASGESTINHSDELYAMTADGTVPVNTDGALRFIGKGHGHGVGLSQYGAKDMAEAGYSYDEILATYFPGTTLTKYLD